MNKLIEGLKIFIASFNVAVAMFSIYMVMVEGNSDLPIVVMLSLICTLLTVQIVLRDK